MVRCLFALLATIGVAAGIAGCGEKAAVTPNKIGDPSKDPGTGVGKDLPPPPK